MPKAKRNKKKDDEWFDDESEKILEEKMRNMSTEDAVNGVADGKKSKKVIDFSQSFFIQIFYSFCEKTRHYKYTVEISPTIRNFSSTCLIWV